MCDCELEDALGGVWVGRIGMARSLRGVYTYPVNCALYQVHGLSMIHPCLGIKKECTLCNVVLDGFASGLASVIFAKRLRINVFSI